MNAGKLDKRITLQPPTETADGAGGRSTVWTNGNVTVWAEFVKPRVAAMQETGAVVSEMVREIRVRLRTDVRKGWRVVFGTRLFDVQHTYEENRDATILVCREVVK